ncbi:MAG: helix-turn-helix domain-containing protein [Clostridia bacterium]|nr:helix-turn-helix domain-containing protein [Clostridia bacterium]
MKLGEAIEQILVESGLSISAFSRQVGYSRQYIYELLKSKDTGFCRKIQLDTLRKICDATGYSLEKLLADIEYIPKPKTEFDPNTVVIIGKNGEKTYYTLSEKDAVLIEQLAKSLHKVADLKESK